MTSRSARIHPVRNQPVMIIHPDDGPNIIKRDFVKVSCRLFEKGNDMSGRRKAIRVYCTQILNSRVDTSKFYTSAPPHDGP